MTAIDNIQKPLPGGGYLNASKDALEDQARAMERAAPRAWDPSRVGQLMPRQGHTEAAEELYRKALSIAEEQEAKLWELRAVASLARLRLDQGRHAKARDLFAPIYGWFTQGFEPPNLREAKALFEALEVLADYAFGPHNLVGGERPEVAPSVTAAAHTAFPELRADRPHHQRGDDSRP